MELFALLARWVTSSGDPRQAQFAFPGQANRGSAPKLPWSIPDQSSLSALLGSYISLPEDLLRAQQHNVSEIRETHFDGPRWMEEKR
jgi:hypothetical protein